MKLIVFVLLSILALQFPSVAKPQVKTVYPTAVRMYGEFMIAGGLLDGKWVPGQCISKLLPTSVEYRLFSVTESLGTGIGKKNASSELQNYFNIPVISMQPKTVSSWNLQYANIGVAGKWSASPRRVSKAFDYATYKPQIKQYLSDKGVNADKLVIDEIVSADLDRNGEEELILTGTFYASEDELPEPQIGDYSYVILLLGKGDNRYYRTIESTVFGREIDLKNKEFTRHKLSGILDVDNDSIMEIVTVTEVFEGGSIQITKLKHGELSYLQVAGR